MYYILMKKLALVFIIGLISLVITAPSNIIHGQILQQQPSPQQQGLGINIISPTNGQQVPIGQLTILGNSIDNSNTDCIVNASWNGQNPSQKAVATGPGGINDYSNWAFTYTGNYHLITEGVNELTATLSC